MIKIMKDHKFKHKYTTFYGSNVQIISFLAIRNKVKKSMFLMLAILTISLFTQEVKALDGSPFSNGQLNPAYEGQMTPLAGEVIDIKSTKEKYSLYKLNLRMEGVDPIWVTSIGTQPMGGIHIGDMIIFRGYISSTNKIDPSGNIVTLINSKTLLLAIRSDRPD